MSRLSPFRMPSFWPRLLLLALALSVYGWHLAYRFSLYAQGTSNFHRVPSARMLSENERGTTKNALLAHGEIKPMLQALSLPLALSLFLLWSRPSASVALRHVEALPQFSSFSALPHAALGAFFFRPPPALVSISLV